MANAPKDQNNVRSRLGVLFSDGVTTVPIRINDATGAMGVNTSDIITVPWPSISPRDENYRYCMMFVGADGLTYPWAVDADGNVLIDT